MRGLAAFFVAALAVASAFLYQEAGSKPLLHRRRGRGLPRRRPPAPPVIARFPKAIAALPWVDRSTGPRPKTRSRTTPATTPYFHAASGQYYTMIRRGGRYYQRRHELGARGPRDQCRREGDPVCAGFRRPCAHLPAADSRRTACRRPRRLVRGKRRILGDESGLRPP